MVLSCFVGGRALDSLYHLVVSTKLDAAHVEVLGSCDADPRCRIVANLFARTVRVIATSKISSKRLCRIDGQQSKYGNPNARGGERRST